MTGNALIQKRIFYSAYAASILLSFWILGSVLANLSTPIGPIIIVNWLAFAAATAAMGPSGILKRGQKITKENHNIWRFVLLAFSGSGLAAVAMGATIF